MRMIEHCDSSHLSLKKTLGIITEIIIRIGSGISAHYFDSNLPVDTSIFSKINIAHATAADEA